MREVTPDRISEILGGILFGLMLATAPIHAHTVLFQTPSPDFDGSGAVDFRIFWFLPVLLVPAVPHMTSMATASSILGISWYSQQPLGSQRPRRAARIQMTKLSCPR
jgi:hypothetical protein